MKNSGYTAAAMSGGKKSLIIKIIAIVLAVVVVAEAVVIGVIGVKLKLTGGESSGSGNIVISADLSAVGDGIGRGVGEGIAMIFNGITGSVPSGDNVGDIIRSVVYSDSVINAIASMTFPLVKQILLDLKMLDFATAASIYPTPEELAELMQGKSYTAYDKSGTILPLADVLTVAGADWAYFDSKINVARADGSVNSTTIWNSINWGVTDKTSFYKALNDLSEGIRGVLEVTLQGKDVNVNVNLVDVLFSSDFINLGMDAAKIYTPLDVCGYEGCLVPLFSMLGLVPGEYPSVAEFKAYTSCADIWKAILEPVLSVVDKALAAPMTVLPSMLVNFADRTTTGALYESMQTMTMYGEFAGLAKSFMGFEDKELANLGVTLADVIKGFGIDITGTFNDILDDLLALITKKSDADVPDMDVDKLRSLSKITKLSNGVEVYTADSDAVVKYLVDWCVSSDIAGMIIDMTDLAGTEEAKKILAAVDDCEASVEKLINLIVPLLKQKLETGTVTTTKLN